MKLEKEYYQDLFATTMKNKKCYIRADRLLHDMISDTYWNRVKDNASTKLNTITIKGDLWVDYEYALDLANQELQELYGVSLFCNEDEPGTIWTVSALKKLEERKENR